MTGNPARAERQEAEIAEAETPAADIIYLPDERQRTKKATSGSNRRKRHHVERFRTDDAEHEALHEQLRFVGLSLGEFVMQLGKIRSGKDVRKRRRGLATEDRKALTQVTVALNRVGNNYNQTARALNELLRIAHELSSARLASQVEALAEAISGMPALLAEPKAAILAVLHQSGEPSDS